MAKSAGFFDSDQKEGTRVKLSVLEWYLVPWAEIVSAYAKRSGHKTIWFVDTFAGQGKTASGENGSPIIAAIRSLLRIRNSRPIKLGLIAVEEDPTRYSQLQESLFPFKKDGVPIATLNGRWTSFTDEINKIIGGAPVLAFVDPFGLKGLEFERMKSILDSPAADVLFRLHDQSIHRNAPNNREIVDRALNTTQWNVGWDRIIDADERIDIAHRAFSHSIRTLMGSSTQVVPFRVRLKWGRKPEFSLVFASKHPAGIDLFHERAADHEIALARDYEQEKRVFPGSFTGQRKQEISSAVSAIFSDFGMPGTKILETVRQRKVVKGTEVHEALRTLRDRDRLTTPSGARGWKNVVWTPSHIER